MLSMIETRCVPSEGIAVIAVATLIESAMPRTGISMTASADGPSELDVGVTMSAAMRLGRLSGVRVRLGADEAEGVLRPCVLFGRKPRRQREHLVAPAISRSCQCEDRWRWNTDITALSNARRRTREGKTNHYTLAALRPHTAEDQEPVIVKSGGGSSFSPLATIRRNPSGKGRCSFSASGISPSSQRSTSSEVVRITGIALG